VSLPHGKIENFNTDTELTDILRGWNFSATDIETELAGFRQFRESLHPWDLYATALINTGGAEETLSLFGPNYKYYMVDCGCAGEVPSGMSVTFDTSAGPCTKYFSFPYYEARLGRTPVGQLMEVLRSDYDFDYMFADPLP